MLERVPVGGLQRGVVPKVPPPIYCSSIYTKEMLHMAMPCWRHAKVGDAHETLGMDRGIID